MPRALTKKVLDCLSSVEAQDALIELEGIPPRKLLPSLYSLLCREEERIRHRAAEAVGIIVAELAREDPEAGRNIVRTLMWRLNEESGGIGWGVPEAMGEIFARHKGLAEEFGHILLSYVKEGGNYLEFPPLQNGAMYGIGRMAEEHPELLKSLDAEAVVVPLLYSDDEEIREHAANIMEFLKAGPGSKNDRVHGRKNPHGSDKKT